MLAGSVTTILVKAGTTEDHNTAVITMDEAVTMTGEAEILADAMAGGTVVVIHLHLPAIAVGRLITLLTGALLN